MTVPRRSFGRHDARCSAVGLGCGGYWGLRTFPFAEAERVVRRSIELGIDTLDTGPSYSRGEAEQRLGRILKNVPERVFVATKVGSVWDRRIKRDLSTNGILQSADDSRRRLGRDRIDLLQLHCRTADEVALPSVTEALIKARQNGTCRFIGMSGTPDAAERAIEAGIFDCVMVTYNVVDRRAGPVIDKARENGLAVFLKSPLAHAAYSPAIYRVTTLRRAWYLLRMLHNYRPELSAGRRFRFLSETPNASAAQAALAYALQRDGVTSAVIGTTSVEHLEEAVAATSFEFSQATFERINATRGL